MNMHVHESRDRRLLHRPDFLRSRGQTHTLPWADRVNHPVADQYSRVWNFRGWGQRSRGMQQNGRHGQVNILAEWRPKEKGRVLWNPPEVLSQALKESALTDRTLLTGRRSARRHGARCFRHAQIT